MKEEKTTEENRKGKTKKPRKRIKKQKGLNLFFNRLNNGLISKILDMSMFLFYFKLTLNKFNSEV